MIGLELRRFLGHPRSMAPDCPNAPDLELGLIRGLVAAHALRSLGGGARPSWAIALTTRARAADDEGPAAPPTSMLVALHPAGAKGLSISRPEARKRGIFACTDARSSPYANARRPRNGAGTPRLTLRAAEAHAAITHGDLTALLYLQGYAQADFAHVP